MTNPDIQAENRQYISIFISLIVFTAVAVFIHSLHLDLTLNIILILTLAFFQAGLSVCYFMHLISERKTIYIVLIFTVIFFLSMILLIYSGYFNHPEGTHYVS